MFDKLMDTIDTNGYKRIQCANMKVWSSGKALSLSLLEEPGEATTQSPLVSSLCANVG